MRKNPSSCDCTEIRTHVPTCQKVSRLPTEPPGRPGCCLKKNQSTPRPSEHPPVRGEKMVVVFFTLTDRASTVPSNIRGCQSGTWSQGGTKVNGSHRGDNPLLTPTGIQIATKSNATLQAMAPTNIKTVHRTSLLHIESSLDRLGLLSPTHDQRSQQQSGQITLLLVYTVVDCAEVTEHQMPFMSFKEKSERT